MKHKTIMLLIALNGVFNASFFSAFWGAYEHALQAGADPIMSHSWSFPVPHHYILGFIGIYACFTLLMSTTFLRLKRQS